MRRPIGPFLGAVIFVLLENFAIDFIDRERFNTLIGICFLAIVLFSPDGILGLWGRLLALFNRVGPASRRLDHPADGGNGIQLATAGRLTTGRK